jgi:O-antigen/teichoic acid export membrane protein
MVSDRVLGTYVAAVRTSELFEALPSTLGATMFPLLCAAASDRLKFDRYLDMTCRLLILAATTICVGISVGAPLLVVLLYGSEFKASAPLLAFLVWSEVPIFFAAVLYNGIVAVGLEKYLIIPAVAGACINLGLNLLLIPRWAAMGSVWATVVAYTVSWMGILLLFSATRPLILRGLRVTIPATALAALVTLGATHLPFNVWIQLVLAMMAFGAGAALLRLVRWSDVEYARGISRQVWSAIGGSKSRKQSEAR